MKVSDQNPVDSQNIFQHIFTESESGLIVVDTKLRVVLWNPWFSKHSGIEIEGVKGKRLIEIFPVLEKGNVERGIFSALINGMSSLVSHGLNRKPFPLIKISGQLIQQQVMLKPIILENNQRYCLIQVIDVSAGINREKQLIEQAKRTKVISEKLAQEKERAQVTLDSIVDAVITTDKEGNILSMNPVAEQLIGVFEEDAQHKNACLFFKLINEKTRKSVSCPISECLQSRHIVANEKEHILIGAAGRFSINDSVSPIIDDDGVLLGSVLVFRDVTQSRALSAELNW